MHEILRILEAYSFKTFLLRKRVAFTLHALNENSMSARECMILSLQIIRA